MAITRKKLEAALHGSSFTDEEQERIVTAATNAEALAARVAELLKDAPSENAPFRYVGFCDETALPTLNVVRNGVRREQVLPTYVQAAGGWWIDAPLDAELRIGATLQGGDNGSLGYVLYGVDYTAVDSDSSGASTTRARRSRRRRGPGAASAPPAAPAESEDKPDAAPAADGDGDAPTDGDGSGGSN